MKPSVPQSSPRPAKGAPRAAALAAGGEKVVKVEVDARRRPGRQSGEFVALAGSGVTAHDAVMKGVSGRALTRLWDSTRDALPADAILRAIGVSARTAHRIKTDPDRPLDARTTDGIYRLQSVRTLAQEVLGSAATADEWLNTEALGLEFRKPIDLLSTSPGAEAVKTLLQRMKYGVYA